jgi:hypothetical protein
MCYYGNANAGVSENQIHPVFEQEERLLGKRAAEARRLSGEMME